MKWYWVLALVVAVILATWCSSYYWQKRQYKKKLAEMKPKPDYDDTNEPSKCGPRPKVGVADGFELQCLEGKWQVVPSSIPATEPGGQGVGSDLLQYF